MSASTTAAISADPPSTGRAIENLIATYAELVDNGDFAGLGALLADATFTGSGAPVSGAADIEQMFRDMLIVYDDGTPRTKHVTTNVIIDADSDEGAGEGTGTATARSYVTVFQARPGLTLQAIMSGRYQDRFERRDGHWRFTERQVRVDLAGDLSGHLRQARR
jgi:3-phenylpropionate/cinnamic acid dioxygenase small subunit